jgi:glycerol kinase
MSRQLVGAIDQGTTSTRFIVFDRAGTAVASAQMEHRQIFPRPGWVEHDPHEILANTEQVIEQALAEAGLAPSDLTAVGITNQRETTVLWDRTTGRAVHNAIVWQDTRTSELCEELARDGGADRLRPVTGLPLATYFSGPKVAWLLASDPSLAAAAHNGDLCFGTIDSWLLWHLTGGYHLTDVTNASRTLLMDLAHLEWSEEACRTIGVPPAVLPEIVPSSGPLAEGVGVLAGVPIAGVLGDQQAALFGQACFDPGAVKNTYGTGCFMLLNTGETPVPSTAGLLTTVAYEIGGQRAVYALEGSVAMAGALVQWLRDNMGLIESSADVEELAASVEDNGDVYLVPAFSGLFAPYWRADARGAILGLTRYATKAHLARAALEATAYQTGEILDAMLTDAGIAISEMKVDGGMVGNDLLMQFQADILDLPVVRPAITETTALGAAYAAGLAEGVWASLDELRANWREDRRFEPGMDAGRRQWLTGRWKKAVGRTFDWV